MRLTRVTITGADDSVDPWALVDLSAEFPFVEWGILYSAKLVGSPRFPTYQWRHSFAKLLDDHDGATALHLCGAASRNVMGGEHVLPCPFSYKRVQLNGFSEYRLPKLRAATLLDGHEFILQCQTSAALDHAAELAKLHPNVSALWDFSGGRGFLDFDMVTSWPAPAGLRVGRAGGISPDNVVDVIESLAEGTSWIDMESGVRTDERFDLTKVRRVLELAKPFVATEAA